MISYLMTDESTADTALVAKRKNAKTAVDAGLVGVLVAQACDVRFSSHWKGASAYWDAGAPSFMYAPAPLAVFTSPVSEPPRR